MEKFTAFESKMVLIPRDNIDTDQIIPARFLKTISKVGVGDQLFCDWRYDASGNPKPDFVLNKPESKSRHVLLVGEEFGAADDLKSLKPFIKEYQPVLVGVGSGADVLRKAGYRPQLIVGDPRPQLVGELEAVAAAVQLPVVEHVRARGELGPVHRRVGALDEAVAVVGIHRRDRDADARADLGPDRIEVERIFEAVGEASRDCAGLLAGGPDEHRGELVAADAREQV